MKSLFFSSGDPSGDIHASVLMDKITTYSQTVIDYYGLGGDNMIRSGLKHLYHVKEISATGYMEVFRKYRFFMKVLNTCSDFIFKHKPDAVILIDYPGFNLKLASRIRKHYKGRIIYYISPQVWAWDTGRVHAIKNLVDKMLVVFPFEVEFYKKFGIQAEYVGHPLIERISIYRRNKSVNSDTVRNKTISALAGSRKHEIKNHLPVLIDTADRLIRKYKLNFIFSKPEFIDEKYYFTGKQTNQHTLSEENVYEIIKKSDVVLTKAGTSSLECALIGTPHLIFYKTSFLNYVLLKPRAMVNYIGIANIIYGREIVKEFVQRNFTSENLVKEVDNILTDEDYCNAMTENFNKLWEILGNKSASETSAEIILNSIK